jgi:hypothetical protein
MERLEDTEKNMTTASVLLKWLPGRWFAGVQWNVCAKSPVEGLCRRWLMALFWLVAPCSPANVDPHSSVPCQFNVSTVRSVRRMCVCKVLFKIHMTMPLCRTPHGQHWHWTDTALTLNWHVTDCSLLNKPGCLMVIDHNLVCINNRNVRSVVNGRVGSGLQSWMRR